MTSERVRAFIGAWMPMIIGAVAILVATNFIVGTSSIPPNWPASLSWDVMRATCAGGLIFVGLLLFVSTSGRYRKVKQARAEGSRPPIPKS